MIPSSETAGVPRVSIVIPVYNMERYLPETLDSVLASDYDNLEVVMVDDGSTDASLEVMRRYASSDSRVRMVSQANAGVCAARNKAISLAAGEYILPVDADNTIEPTFVKDAVAILEGHPEVKVVAPRADFFGSHQGEWTLPPFSLHLLARKNIMDTCCAMYRKKDWTRVGGYCEEIIVHEDWEFWISVLKDGGEVCRLPYIALHYRVREGMERTHDRRLKRHVVDTLNRRHPEFFERELGGPLHYNRSWSVFLNRLSRIFHPDGFAVNARFETAGWPYFIKALPWSFGFTGAVIHSGRNELREMSYGGMDVVVKSFHVPNLVNRIAYGLFRPSKARRSYEYAWKLLDAGIGTPFPVGYCSRRDGLLFGRSYYVSRKSDCPYTYADLLKRPFENQEEILRAIARTTARMHECGFLHKDYSRGNILFRVEEGRVKVEIVDLNRIRFRTVGLETGCRNFERLPGTRDMFAVLADEYAKARGFDPGICLALMQKYSDERHEAV